MKTAAEIMIEARRLEALAVSQRAEFRQNEAVICARLASAESDPFSSDPEGPASGQRSPLVGLLTTLSPVDVHSREGVHGDLEAVRRYRIVREIEVSLSSEPAEYRLREERFELVSADSAVSIFGPYVALVGDSAQGMLEEGYERNAEDEMMDRLFPIIDTLDEREKDEVTAEEIAEVEKLLELPPLSAAMRLRVRGEIIDFLEGRLDSVNFIAHAVHWQGASQCESETLSERHGIRLMIDTP